LLVCLNSILVKNNSKNANKIEVKKIRPTVKNLWSGIELKITKFVKGMPGGQKLIIQASFGARTLSLYMLNAKARYHFLSPAPNSFKRVSGFLKIKSGLVKNLKFIKY
jgi:hypothetical protein